MSTEWNKETIPSLTLEPDLNDAPELVVAEETAMQPTQPETVLTPEGKEFLKRYRKFEQEVRAGADASFQKWFGTEEK